MKSYDFQAAIRESGEIAESYKKVKNCITLSMSLRKT